MDHRPRSDRGTGLARLALVAAAAGLAGWGASSTGLPAGWLVGPMLAALVLALRGVARPRVSRWAWRGAQAVVGLTISATFSASSLPVLAHRWPAVLAAILLVLILAMLAGVILARIAPVSPPTAFVGTMPGGASAMVVLADEVGADPRLVAFMQYLRLVLTVLTVTATAPLFPAGAPSTSTVSPFAAHASVPEYVLTAGVALAMVLLSLRLPLPAGALILPVLAGVVLGIAGVRHGIWPPGVLELAYAVIGVRVGGQFDADAMRRAGRAAPAVLGFVLLLMAACGGLAWGISRLAGIDPLTAYLATAPGGMDSVMIVALDTGAQTPTVLGLQMARLLIVILSAPLLVRWLRRWGPRG